MASGLLRQHPLAVPAHALQQHTIMHVIASCTAARFAGRPKDVQLHHALLLAMPASDHTGQPLLV
jgi:hypothetical protein